MHQKDLEKVVVLVQPQLKNNGALAGNTYVDTMGFGKLRILIALGTTDVIVGSADTSHPLKVEECDTTDGTYTDVTGAALSAVLGAGDDNKVYAIDIDLANKAHKRYMEVNAPTAGNSTGANMTIIAELSQPAIAPASATARGLTEQIKV